MRSYVGTLKECRTREDFERTVKDLDASVASELHMGFLSRFQATFAKHNFALPFSQTALQKDLTLSFICGRAYLRYMIDSIFSTFDEAQWDKEFIEHRAAQGERSSEYKLMDFFREKCDEAFSQEPLSGLVEVISRGSPGYSVHSLTESFVGNFEDGMRHMPDLKKIATSDEDLRKRVRAVMHLNASTHLFTALMHAGEGHSYFWHPLSKFIMEAATADDIHLNMACDIEVPLKTMRSDRPTFGCPAHYLPTPIFNGIIDLMAKYSETKPKGTHPLAPEIEE